MTGYYGLANEKALNEMLKPIYKYKMARKMPEGFDSSELEDEIHGYLLENSLDFVEYCAKHKLTNKSVNKQIDKLVDWRQYWVDMAVFFKKKYKVTDKDLRAMCKYISLVAWFMADDYENNRPTKRGITVDLDSDFGKKSNNHAIAKFSALSLAMHYMAGEKDGSAVWGEGK